MRNILAYVTVDNVAWNKLEVLTCNFNVTKEGLTLRVGSEKL